MMIRKISSLARMTEVNAMEMVKATQRGRTVNAVRNMIGNQTKLGKTNGQGKYIQNRIQNVFRPQQPAVDQPSE